jgi:hypothetical protein
VEDGRGLLPVWPNKTESHKFAFPKIAKRWCVIQKTIKLHEFQANAMNGYLLARYYKLRPLGGVGCEFGRSGGPDAVNSSQGRCRREGILHRLSSSSCLWMLLSQSCASLKLEKAQILFPSFLPSITKSVLFYACHPFPEIAEGLIRIQFKLKLQNKPRQRDQRDQP